MPAAQQEAPFGALGIINVAPHSTEGHLPRVELGEQFTISAQMFTSGRAPVAGSVTLIDPTGTEHIFPMTCTERGMDQFEAQVQAGQPSSARPWEAAFDAIRPQLGEWTYIINAWEDQFNLWLHDAQIKIGVGEDMENTLLEGAHIVSQWAQSADAHLSAQQVQFLTNVASKLSSNVLNASERLGAAEDPRVEQLNTSHPLRHHLTHSVAHSFTVERPHSSDTAWYQFFVRSEGAHWDSLHRYIIPGNLVTALAGLKRAAAEGFNVVYIPPLSPIGVTHRKGKNGALTPAPEDPGSPWAIGSEQGGHDAIDPALGTWADFRRFTDRAHELGLEVAVDFALQCSPDHPWVREHPDWFTHRPDGSIACAENPPMKYEDIYPLNFDNDLQGIVDECARVLTTWVDAGVTMFRVDNPHTKPMRFWKLLFDKMRQTHPEVLYLAESFTRPALRQGLAYSGFTQSHCYFQWRTTKKELAEYLPEVNGENAFLQHDTFWPSTPDNLTDYLRDGGISGHCVRAVLAALGSPSWGIYSGYELCENQQIPGTQTPLNSEIFEIKCRDWNKADQLGIKSLITRLNQIRNAHVCTRSFHNLTVHKSDNGNILVFSRYTPANLTADGKPDALIVVVNLDAHQAQASNVTLDLSALGLPQDAHFAVHDEITGNTWQWGKKNWVRLDPNQNVAHVLSVRYAD
jgi:starch synthase (maltosyl-transferring)